VPTQRSDTLIADNDDDQILINSEENKLINSVKDSGKLVTMNLEEEEEETDDDESDEKMKGNQLHLNTLSDISMLTFPEVDENVDTYRQHSRCLLEFSFDQSSPKCSPYKFGSRQEKCSPPKHLNEHHNDHHNDLPDETNTYNDVNLIKDFSNTSTAHVRFAEEDDEDHIDVHRYTADATLNSGDHSSELDSDLDAEFDQFDQFDQEEDDELVLLKENELASEEVKTDVCNQVNRPKIIDLSRLAADDTVIFNQTNLENFVSSKYSM